MKKLLSLIIIASMIFAMAVPVKSEQPGNYLRESTIFDALEILKSLVGIPNNAAEIMGKSDLTIFDALDVLKGLAGMANAVMVNAKFCGLPNDLAERIKSDFMQHLIRVGLAPRPQDNPEIIIQDYLGTYNGSVVAKLVLSCRAYSANAWTESVAGYDFHYSNGNHILVWNNGNFYKLSSQVLSIWNIPFEDDGAFEMGLLTEEDVYNINYNYCSGIVMRTPPQCPYCGYPEKKSSFFTQELQTTLKNDWLNQTFGENHGMDIDDVIWWRGVAVYPFGIIFGINHESLRTEEVIFNNVTDVASDDHLLETYGGSHHPWTEDGVDLEKVPIYGHRTFIWSEGTVYTLSDAYNEGIFTEQDAGNIDDCMHRDKH